MHARIFQHAVQWLAPKGTPRQDAVLLMQQYEALIEDAMQRHDLAETVLATQIMLESLGEVCLDRLNTGMANRGVGFRRLRQIVLTRNGRTTTSAGVSLKPTSLRMRRSAIRYKSAPPTTGLLSIR